MSSSKLIRFGGWAAIIGGLMWVVKGMSILITGVQPPVLFEAALPFFGVGLLGLAARLGEERGALGKAGVVVACVVMASAVAAFVTAAPPLIAVAGFGPFLGLILLGSATLQARIFPSAWSALPLAMGLSGPILILGGGGLAMVHERLLEIPLVLVGIAWMLQGYSVLNVKSEAVGSRARPT